jgi:hypothetical protein
MLALMPQQRKPLSERLGKEIKVFKNAKETQVDSNT